MIGNHTRREVHRLDRFKLIVALIILAILIILLALRPTQETSAPASLTNFHGAKHGANIEAIANPEPELERSDDVKIVVEGIVVGPV